MEYTKQQLKEAYFAAIEDNPSTVMDDDYFASKIESAQAKIDKKLSRLQKRKENIIAKGIAKVDDIQNRIDKIEPDAKIAMKNMALAYLADQAEAQSDVDNSGVNL